MVGRNTGGGTCCRSRGDSRRLGRGFSPSEGHALRLRHWGHEHCSERSLEGTRIENKDTGTIATKLGPIAVLANA